MSAGRLSRSSGRLAKDRKVPFGRCQVPNEYAFVLFDSSYGGGASFGNAKGGGFQKVYGGGGSTKHSGRFESTS